GIVEFPEREEAFRGGLRDLGYVPGQNVRIEYRFATAGAKPLADLAAELVGLRVDGIVAAGGGALDAARRQTSTVPIVFPLASDPVAAGYVASLGHPGGNITGLSTLNQETAGKRMELLKEVVPRLSRVAILSNPGNPSSRVTAVQTQAAGERLGLQ